MKIGFVGLSHLGLCYLAASAFKGCNVIGFTKNKNYYESIKDYKFDIKEKNLIKIIKKNKRRISFTNNILDLNKADLIFISLDVETNANGISNLEDLKKYFKLIFKKIQKNKTLILLSQVPPGFTDSIKWNKNKLFYQVETLIFGDALKRALYPERIIIGKNNENKKINSLLIKYYKLFTTNQIIMSYKSAELTKISINMYLASSITTTNTLAEICENISADWKDIIPALQSDRRIGKYAYLSPGLGIGGGNIIRDIKTLINIANKSKSSKSLMNSIISNSNRRKLWTAKKIENLMKKFKFNKISILGLTYKEGTNSILNSPSIFIINYFKDIEFFAYDPLVKKINKFKNLTICNNYEEAIIGSNIVILSTPNKEYKKIEFKKYKSLKYFFDPLGYIDTDLEKSKFKYFKIGN